MPRALISVSDKTGIVDLARGLTALEWEIVSTGGTAQALRDASVRVLDVADITRHPEMMEGRVKTLHPAVHAGILARRDRHDDFEALRSEGYGTIDLVAVNLYPFHEAAAANAPIPKAMDKVDIGGPTMLRAAAKNHAGVIVMVDPADYARVLEALRTGGVPPAMRVELARKVFHHTADYDAAIARHFDRHAADGAGDDGGDLFPANIGLSLDRVQSLRYGENPDQAAAFYREAGAPEGSLPHLEQLNGKELSFNNLLDVEAGASAVTAWMGEDRVACVVIKHTTPCGVALGGPPGEA
jgi:phosphoribosylaminoimidazolecarboxamide formyltransferase/IMP cyclohydrolase